MGVLNDEAVGFCKLGLDNAQPHVATLYSLFIISIYRGKGYAGNLILASLGATQAHGKRRDAGVHEANGAAVSLHNDFGFQRG